MKIKRLSLFMFASSLTMAACAVHRVHDYSFDVIGSVTAEDKSSLQNVEVILQVETPIYEGMAPVKRQQLITDKGVFIFRCLSHNPVTKYTLTIQKRGFEPQTVSGSAPPDGHHIIILKRAVTNDAADS